MVCVFIKPFSNYTIGYFSRCCAIKKVNIIFPYKKMFPTNIANSIFANTPVIATLHL